MAERASQQQIDSALSGLPGWAQVGNTIEREVELEDFAAALAFVNAVGAKAEEVNHHPDLLLHGFNKVRITLSTHSIGALTKNDFDLAGVINSLDA